MRGRGGPSSSRFANFKHLPGRAVRVTLHAVAPCQSGAPVCARHDRPLSSWDRCRSKRSVLMANVRRNAAQWMTPLPSKACAHTSHVASPRAVPDAMVEERVRGGTTARDAVQQAAEERQSPRAAGSGAQHVIPVNLDAAPSGALRLLAPRAIDILLDVSPLMMLWHASCSVHP